MRISKKDAISTAVTDSSNKSEISHNATNDISDILSQPEGSPLDSSTRGFMESSLDHDFSNVRIHRDPRAAESARSVNALAYTVGNDIVFESGQYSPASTEGRKLIAHELIHVIQQSAIPSGSEVNGTDLSVSSQSIRTPISDSIRNFTSPMVARRPRGAGASRSGGGKVLVDNSILVQLYETRGTREHELGVTGRVYVIESTKGEFLEGHTSGDWEILQKKYNIEVLDDPSRGVLADQRRSARAAGMEMGEDWFTSVDAKISTATSRERRIPLATQDEGGPRQGVIDWAL